MDPHSLSGRNRSSLEVIPPTGLTVLVDPEEASLDIVFVHGFNGHPERTWTHKRGDAKARDEDDESQSAEPPSKVRKLNMFSGLQQKNSTSRTVYWPRELVQEVIPNARVLTFGYDTHVRHVLGPPVSRSTVYDIAWDFLVALEAERRRESSRPILFIAHSLGGIVVKEMLRRSSSCHLSQPQLQEVFESTIGIMFFGTPHGGADPRGFLQHVAEKAIKAAGFTVNKQIVDTLLPSAERLKELRDEFSPMAHQKRWIIHSFQEQIGVNLLSGHKVVEDVSSYLNFPTIETTEHIGRDHMGMCRFTGLEDVEYKKVAAALCRMTNTIVRETKKREFPSLGEEQRRILLDSLRFDQIDARKMTIKNGHAKTCKWLLKMPEYLDWLDINKLAEHHGFLWIKGKPGTGKSTLMKFAHAHARKTMKDKIIISFFFNARGEDLEKSTAGMYRSLLLQFLERVPELERVFDSLGSTIITNNGSHQWTVETLKELFQQAILQLGKRALTCFIDALDECEERQVRDMVSFFEQVGELAISSGIKFQVCFSSRHYPHITISKGLHLVLEGQEGHNQDITNYLDSELKLGHGRLAQEIRGELQTKASGVFMWVVLVVEILNKENDGGRVHVLRQRLRDIPNDLHELFREILMRDCHNRDELLLCIQWILFAKHPLKPDELYFAILSGVAPEALRSGNADEITMDVMKKFILNSSKGLAEITKSKTPTVQFIHESVKDFLVKENGLGELFPDLGGNFEGQSHERLKKCCLAYMGIDLSAHLDLNEPLPKASSELATDLRQLATKTFPFLEYGVNFVLHHADAAQNGGVDQGEFIQHFPLADWIKLYNLLEKKEVRRYRPKASLLYLLAEHNASNLIRIHPRNLSYCEVEDERYGLPLFAALAVGSKEAVQTFIELEIDETPPTSKLRKIYSNYRYDKSRQIASGRDLKFSKRRGILSYMPDLGDEILWAFLLDSRKVSVAGIKDNDGRSPLSWAAANGYTAVVKLLLETGEVDVDLRDSHYGRTPLSQAAESGHEAVVKLLLAIGKVDADSRDNRGRTPLSWAAGNSHEAVVKLLLATSKVDTDLRDNEGRSPLSWAAGNGYEAAVKLLLATGKVDTDSRDNDYRTPLSWAAGNSHEAAIKLLLATGKIDADSRDNDGRTPLSWAAIFGREAVIKLLLITGKVDVDSRDNNSRSPLSWAARNGYEAAIKLLLATGKVDADSRDNNSRSPLSWAARNGYEAAVKLLLATGKVDADSRDNNYRSPLSWAARNGYEAAVKLLLATGKVDADSRDNNYRTPLSWAAGNSHEAAIKLLLATGKVDADSRDNDGRSPLSWAAENGREAVVKLLLATGKVDADSREKNGRTPLWHAANADSFYHSERVIPMLLATGKVDPFAEDNLGTSPFAKTKASGRVSRDEILEQFLLYREKHKT